MYWNFRWRCDIEISCLRGFLSLILMIFDVLVRHICDVEIAYIW